MPFAVRLERRITAWKNRPQGIHVVLRPHLVEQRPETNLDLPSYVLPIQPSVAELGRFRAFPAVRLRDPDRCDARVYEGEDDVAGRHLPHRLVKGIASAIGVALG